MKLIFEIQYKTFIGQNLILCIYNAKSESEMMPSYLSMQLTNEETGIWQYTLNTNSHADIEYRYVVRDDNFKTDIEEWGNNRVYRTAAIDKNKIVVIRDQWRSMSDPEYALYSSAFLNAILKQAGHYDAPLAKVSRKSDTVVLRFKPSIIRIKPGHRVAVCGNSKVLGNWNEKKALTLGNPFHPQWLGEVTIEKKDFPIHYKYLIQDENCNFLFWEKSFDRVISLPEDALVDCIEIGDDKFDFPQYPWKGTGVAIPVFSLRRENGFGVGEFTDIKLLVDWAAEVGIKLVQILPVNDTVAKHTWQDSYPYAAISVYAMHPIYINLNEIGTLQSDINQQIIEAQGRFLNSLDKIDYEAVMALKSRFFKLYYDQCHAEFLASNEFKQFFDENEFWLKPYAAFSYLRDLFNTPDFSRWGSYSNPTEELLSLLTDKKSAHYNDIAVHYFIQFHAYKQLLEAANYARSKGIVLKGDIPIGIFRNSVDAWLQPHLYHMNCQAGAPPDDFSTKGQNWRFPTYNWEEMAKDNYKWWQQRLQQLSGYFDAFRIDHILGFFRIWEIPSAQVEGLMGYFNPSIPYSREELQNRGLWFDDHRMCKPYIREHFLYERFGDLTHFVKENYLVEYAPGCYNLHENYNTQQKIETNITVEPDCSPEQRSRLNRIINGLYSLVAEVLFLYAPNTGNNAYFPRNALHFTRSYQELDGHSKHLVNQIYLEYFYERNETYWRGKAMEKLPVIKKATNMLLCGEDLGMVPACVPDVMKDLGILSLEVQRMPKNPKITFGHPADYPYLSVATPSSHDTSTVRGWWEEDYTQSQQFYYEILGQHGPAPAFCSSDLVKQIIIQHLFSPSMWAIFPIQDLLGMNDALRLQNPHSERINNPGKPNHYWRYRMHLSMEQLLNQTDFNSNLKELIQNAGRYDVY